MQWHAVTRKILGGPGKIFGGQWPTGTPLAPPLCFRIKMRGYVEKKQQPSQHQFCRHNIRYHKFIWKHHIWCHVKISEVTTLVSMIPNFWCSLEVAAAELLLCFVIKGSLWWKGTFLPMVLLSLCCIINKWSYSSHLHQMLLCGASEKV